MNKSQTLPRSMGGTRTTPTGTSGGTVNGGIMGGNGSSGGTTAGGMPKIVPKPAATPPAIRRQFSVSFALRVFMIAAFIIIHCHYLPL